VPLPSDPRRRRLYRLDQLPLVEALPGWLRAETDGYDGYEFRPLDYVEVQLWSDRPVASFLAAGSS